MRSGKRSAQTPLTPAQIQEESRRRRRNLDKVINSMDDIDVSTLKVDNSVVDRWCQEREVQELRKLVKFMEMQRNAEMN